MPTWRLQQQTAQTYKLVKSLEENEWWRMMTDRNKVSECLVTGDGLCLQELQVPITFIGRVCQWHAGNDK